MKKEKILFNFIFIGIFLINSIFVINNSDSMNNESIQNLETNSSQLVLNNFDPFYLDNDGSAVSSTKTSSEISFSYSGSSSSYPIYEVYKYFFDKNFTDFNVSVKVDFDMESNSDLLTIVLSVYGAGHRIINGGLWDCQTGTTGAYHYTAYPDAVKDQYYTFYGDSPLSGSFYIHFERAGDIVNAFTNDGSNTNELFSHTWSSGLNNNATGLGIHIYTGTSNSDCSVTFSNLNAVFNYTKVTVIFGGGLTKTIITITSALGIVFIIAILRKQRKLV